MPNWLPKALEPGEFDQLLDEMNTRSHAERDVLALLLLHDAGLRVQEVCSLPFTSVNRERTALRVTGKKQKTAILPMSERLRDAWDIWSVVRPAVPGPVLVTARGNQVWPQHYRRLLARVGWNVLGKHVHPHMLRHTIITELAVDLGVPLPIVKQFARHSNIATTEVYLHVRPEWGEDVRHALNRRVPVQPTHSDMPRSGLLGPVLGIRDARSVPGGDPEVDSA